MFGEHLRTAVQRYTVGCAAIVFASATPAGAVVVVDQDALVPSPTPFARSAITIGDRSPPPGISAPSLVNARVGQSVTAGVTGKLVTIEVQGPFWSSIFGLGHAVQLTLFSGSLAAGATPVGAPFSLPVIALPTSGSLNSGGSAFFDVSGNGFNVTAGSVFSFGLELVGPPGANGGIIVGNVAGSSAAPVFQYNDYAGGSAFFSNNGSPYAATPRDIGFRTYVDTAAPAVIPEPASWLMVILGMFGTALALRHRPAKAVAAAVL